MRGFSISAAFYDDSGPAAVLEVGKSVELRVTVTADHAAEYVMVEIPIPAGCSYNSKGRGSYKEMHREYHKERVAVFCSRLTEGTHEFTVKLLPRYTGSYHLNPARVEMMYFPTFFGRENSGILEIGERKTTD